MNTMRLDTTAHLGRLVDVVHKPQFGRRPKCCSRFLTIFENIFLPLFFCPFRRKKKDGEIEVGILTKRQIAVGILTYRQFMFAF